jgi:hypothetical protein
LERMLGRHLGPSETCIQPRCSPFTRWPHPNAKVLRLGFELDDPYVEHVYAGVVGSTSVELLRRLPLLSRAR